MRVAQSSDELLFQLHEIRPRDAVKSFRRSIIEGYPGDVCAYCGRPATSWTLDHIIPKSKAGLRDVGIWLDVVLTATAIKDHTIFCLGIDRNFLGGKSRKYVVPVDAPQFRYG